MTKQEASERYMAICLLLSLTACGVDKSRIADNRISE